MKHEGPVQRTWNKTKNIIISYSLAAIIISILLLNSCEQETYNHNIYGKKSSPDRAKIEAYQQGKPKTTTVNNGQYNIGFTTKNMIETIDSITATAPGHKKQTKYNITVGDNKKIEFNLEYINKKKYFTLQGEESTPNAKGKAWDEGKQIITINTDEKGTYKTKEQELPKDNQIDSITISANGKKELTIKYINIKEGANKLELKLEDNHYNHQWKGTVKSSKTGKKIKNGTNIGLVLTRNEKDTTWTTTNNETYEINKNTTNKKEEYTITIKNIPGHNNKTITGTNNGNETEEIKTTITAKNYNANIPIRVNNKRGENIEGANINYKEEKETTNKEGKTTITIKNIETNQYNEPLTNYELTITTTKENYQEDKRNINYKEGNNKETTITLEDIIQTNTINYITNVNTGTAWLVKKQTTDTLYANIQNNGQAKIEFKHIAAQPNNTIIIGVKAPRKIPQQREKNITGENNYTENFNLEEQPQNNYNIRGRGHLIGAIITGEPNEAMDYLNEGEIRITTKKDLTTHDISIDENGYFNGEITGYYQPTDTIIIDFINNPLVTTNTFSILEADKVASIGKIRNNDGSYVASAQEQRFTQYKAKTTIEKITNKNLLFIAFSDEAYKLPDDLMNIRAPTNYGIISYTEPEVTFVNDTIVWDGLETPLTTKQIQEQEEAIDFIREQLTTRTGITLVNSKKIKSGRDRTNIRGKCYIYKSNGQAGNGSVGDIPNTFYASEATTNPDEGRNLIINEGSTAQNGTWDLASGGSGNCFVFDESWNVIDYSWAGNVTKNTSYLFPPGFFKKK